MIEKIYHIYVNNKCIYHSLSEDDFTNKWKDLNYMIELVSDVTKKDLHYEEVLSHKDISHNSSY